MRAAIPFQLPQESGLTELGGAQAFAANVLVDTKGAITRRPGLATVAGLYSDPVDSDGLSALHVTSTDSVYAVSNTEPSKRIYRVTASLDELTSLATLPRLRGTGRPIIAETEAMLALAAGEAPLKVLLSDDSLSLLGGAPADCTHVIAQSARLLMNDTSSKGLIWYSGQALGSSITGHETWTGLDTGFFSHEARPDPLLALHENTNEVFGFGSTSLQVWSPDSVTAFAPAATREYGIEATYSPIKREQSFAWLDARRRFVLSDGRSSEILSTPIQQTLNDLGTVSDCWGFWYHEGIADCLVWVFPTERRAFAYQVGRGWSEWLGWSAGNWSQMNIGCAAERSYLGARLVGTLSGSVARLTRAAETDLGETIVADIRTGFQNRDTESMKHSLAVWLALKRGSAQATDEPIAWLSWRDRPDGPWRRRAVRLGATGDTQAVVRLPALGAYRRRQWRFEFSASDLELVSAEEEYEVSEV